MNLLISMGSEIGLIAVTNTSFGKIVRRHFDLHLVTRQNFDVMHSHFTGNMADDDMTILKLHSEHGIGQSFQYGTILFD